MASKIILGIPGNWTSHAEIVEAILRRAKGYEFAGSLLQLPSGQYFELEVYDYDARLREAFAIAGNGRLSTDTLEAIDNSDKTLYLLAPANGPEDLPAVMNAVQALIAAGGLAVKVESSGLAHSVGKWEELCLRKDSWRYIEAFVQYLQRSDAVFLTCGMHNLQQPDAILEGEGSINKAVTILQGFLNYLVQNRPNMQEGELFRPEKDGPTYELRKEPCTTYPPGDLFHNPKGYWKLIRQ